MFIACMHAQSRAPAFSCAPLDVPCTRDHTLQQSLVCVPVICVCHARFSFDVSTPLTQPPQSGQGAGEESEAHAQGHRPEKETASDGDDGPLLLVLLLLLLLFACGHRRLGTRRGRGPRASGSIREGGAGGYGARSRAIFFFFFVVVALLGGAVLGFGGGLVVVEACVVRGFGTRLVLFKLS